MRAAAVIRAAALVLVATATATAVVWLCSSPGFLNGGHGSIYSRLLRSREESKTLAATHRKLLVQGEENVDEPDRMWGEKCSQSDIMIDQGPTAPLPSGIPTYTVEISNVCVTGCNISRIHLTCGWFSSATLVNPKVFRRIRYNDCLVNDGKPLVNGGSVSFKYANTFLYPLKVSFVACQ